jgi:hypothetical protein
VSYLSRRYPALTVTTSRQVYSCTRSKGPMSATGNTTRRRSSSNREPILEKFRRTQRRRDELHAAAADTWTSPICTTEGAYQHKAECWNDVAQMAFLYSDGIKELTQPALLFGNISTMASRMTAKQPRWAIYLEAMRSRFVRQVLNMGATCDSAEPGPYRAGGINALTAAIFGAPKIDAPERVSRATYSGGSNLFDIAAALIRLFDLIPTVRRHILLFKQDETVRIPLPVEQIGCILIGARNRTSSHATCLYTCNGVDYFFDNYIGVFQTPWRSWLQLPGATLLNLTVHTQDKRLVSPFWPAVAAGGRIFLANPLPDGPLYIVREWDGDRSTKKVWETDALKIAAAPTSFVSDLTIIEFKKPPVPNAPPRFIGRGPYRRPYKNMTGVTIDYGGDVTTQT